jgi:hypothetical protein
MLLASSLTFAQGQQGGPPPGGGQGVPFKVNTFVLKPANTPPVTPHTTLELTGSGATGNHVDIRYYWTPPGWTAAITLGPFRAPTSTTGTFSHSFANNGGDIPSGSFGVSVSNVPANGVTATATPVVVP